MISFTTIKIKKKVFIHGGNFEIKPQAINLITGKNGVGKSLLLAQIHESEDYTTALIAQNSDELIHSVTTLDNISLTIEKKKELEAIRALLLYFHMDYLLDAKVRKMSGGEKRILAIIRGLFSDAPLILIDEPTNDLDFQKVDLLLELLEKFCETKTFIIVTHDDRLHKIANMHYGIENQHILKFKEEKEFNKHTKFLNDVQHTPNKIGKLFSINFLTLALLSTISIFIFFMMQDVKSAYIEQVPPILPNQVDLFSPFTIFQDNLLEALPLSIFELIEDGRIPSYREIRDYVEELSNRAFTFTLEIEESSDYILFPIEYFQLGAWGNLYPLEIYTTDILNRESGSVFVNTSDVFIGIWEEIFEGAYIYQLDEALYRKAVEILYERYNEELDPLKLTYAVLILNESIDFWDFLQSEQIMRLSEGHYFIRSNETIHLINQAIMLDTNTGMRNRALALGCLVFIVNTMYTFLYVKINKKNVRILQNYGFSNEEIILAIKNKFNFMNISFISTLIVIFTNFIVVLNSPIHTYVVSYIPSVVISLAMLISHSINKKIIAYKIKYLSRWNVR